jgi:hypothetical protein
MNEEYARNVRGVRFRVLLCALIFVVAGVGGIADALYLERATPPLSVVPTYGFAILFGVMMAAIPTMSYLLTRALRRAPGAMCCIHCGRTMWDNTIIAIQTAVLNRCPWCYKSLKWRRGFDVQKPETADSEKPDGRS